VTEYDKDASEYPDRHSVEKQTFKLRMLQVCYYPS
jgi:hypothetical protein